MVDYNGWYIGSASLAFNGGFDVNLKYASYQNITFDGMTFTDNGNGNKEGAALSVKARDDAPSYSSLPATLNNVVITGSIFNNNERGIRFGEPGKVNAGPTSVKVENNQITNNVKTYAGADGSTYGGVINHTSSPSIGVHRNNLTSNTDQSVYSNANAHVDAKFNWWGSASGPGPVGPGSGDNVSTYVDYCAWLDAPAPGGAVVPAQTVQNIDTGEYFCSIQAAIDDSDTANGHTIVAGDGTYNESPNVTKELTIKSLNGRDATTITLQSGPTYLGGLTVNASNVTIDGFTVKGFDAVGSGLASSNIVVVNGKDNVKVRNMRILVGQVGAGTNGDDGMGLITYYSEGPDLIDSLTVTNTIFTPLGSSAFRAFYINPGVDVFVFKSNTITGKFSGTSITQAQDGLIEENSVTGVYPGGGDSRGLGVWGYPDPTVWGHTTFRSNVISGTNRAIGLFDAESALVEKNILQNNGSGVEVIDTGSSGPFDASTIVVRRNDLSLTMTGISNGDGDTADGRCNWWGAADGPGPVGAGSGSNVSAGVTFAPFLTSSDLDGPCIPSLTVKKVVIGPVGSSDWSFDGPTGTFTLPAAGGQTTFYDLAAGTYAITETTQPDYATAVGCDNGASGGASITVNTGVFMQVTCVFTNTKRGTIIIEKQTVPDGATDLFTFSGAVSGSIGDGGQLTVSDVAPGQYTVTEADPGPLWALSSIVCDDSGSATPSTGNVGARTATINVDADETVKCVFNNTRTRATITIIKDSTPKSTQNFNFNAGPRVPLLNGGNEGGVLSAFMLDDAVPSDNDLYPKQRSFLLPNGTYNFSEVLPSNWILKAIECTTGDGSSVVVTLPGVAITLGGGDVTCTFKNQLSVTIQTLKYKDTNGNGVRNAGEPVLANFSISATLQPTGTLFGPFLTNSLGRANFNFIPAGTYKVCENLALSPPGYVNTQPVGVPCYTLTLTPGQTASVNFGNKPAPISSAEESQELTPLSPYAGVTIVDGDPNAIDGYAIDWAAWVDANLLTPAEEPVDAPDEADLTPKIYLPVVVK